jgi:hypothetical protein
MGLPGMFHTHCMQVHWWEHRWACSTRIKGARVVEWERRGAIVEGVAVGAFGKRLTWSSSVGAVRLALVERW